MRRKTRLSIKRKISGTVAGLLAVVSVLSSVSSIPAYATESSVKFSYEQKKEEKVGIYVEAANESFTPGEEVNLTITVRNNTDETLTNGVLKLTDSKNVIENGSFQFTASEDGETIEIATPGEANASAVDTVTTPADGETASADDSGSSSPAAETSATTEENVPSGPASDTSTGTTVSYGPASDNGEYATTTQDDDSAFDEDVYNEDVGYSAPYMDEEGRIRNITLAPGQSFEVPFKGTIDSGIYGVVNRELRFSFSARKENGNKISNYTKFSFNTGMMTMLPVKQAEDEIGADEDGSMILHLGLDNMEFMFDDEGGSGGSGTGPAAATPSEAATPGEADEVITPDVTQQPESETATPSEADKAVTPEEEQPENREAPPSEAATPSELTKENETEVAIIESEEEDDEDEGTASEAEKGTPSDADRTGSSSSDDDDKEESDGVFEKEDIKYTIQTYGIKLEDVKAYFDEAACGPAESVVVVDYHVAEDTEPGTYFGKVTASYKYRGKTYATTQGFRIEVGGLRELVLNGEFNGAQVEVKGPRDSFPSGKNLSLKISELSEEQKVLLQQAMEKMEAEQGKAAEKMVFMDIEVIADGEVKQLRGAVNVTFTNLELESTEEGSTEKVKASVAGEVEVFHLNEESATLDAVEGGLANNGDVVMTAEHFSPYGIMLTSEVSNASKYFPGTNEGELRYPEIVECTEFQNDFVKVNAAVPSEYGAYGLVLGEQSADSVEVTFPEIDEKYKNVYYKNSDETWVNKAKDIQSAWTNTKLNSSGVNNSSGGNIVLTVEDREKIKDNFSALYTNVGMYAGKKVDLKVTVKDYQLYEGKNASGDAILGLCTTMEAANYNKGKIIPGVTVKGVSWVELQYDFYISGTNQLVDEYLDEKYPDENRTLKGNTSYYDVDWAQVVHMKDDTCKGVYVTGSCENYIGNIEGEPGYAVYSGAADESCTAATAKTCHAFTEIFEGSTLTRVFSFHRNTKSNTADGAIYHNGLEVIREGILRVTKKVEGPGSLDLNKDFTFTITLSDTSINTTSEKTYGDVEFKNGEGKFVLKHGDTVEMRNLPIDKETGKLTYTVTELDYDGYTPTIDGVATNTVTGELRANIEMATIPRVVFVNKTGYELPVTGGAGTEKFTYGGLLAMITAAGYLLLYERKQRRKEENATV